MAKDEKYLLITNSATGAETEIIAYRRVLDGSVVISEQVKQHATVDFQDAHTPGTLITQVPHVVTGGSVTSRQPVLPVFDGVIRLAGGVILAIFGYTSANAEIVDQPVGDLGPTRNYWATGSTADREALLPALFFPGDNRGTIVFEVSEGEDISWFLDTYAGGGYVAVDYDQAVSDEVLFQTGDLIRKVFPARLTYQSRDLNDVQQIALEDIDSLTFNDAGFSFDKKTTFIHSRLPNDSLPVDHWRERNTAIRIEGGFLQAHANQSTVSRQTKAELDREFARGELFSVPSQFLSVSDELLVPSEIVQAGEAGGSASDTAGSRDDQILFKAAEFYDDSRFTGSDNGRVHYYVRTGPLDYVWGGVIHIPVAWESLEIERFGRGVDVSPNGHWLIVVAFNGIGDIALYDLTSGVPVYVKTLDYAATHAASDVQWVSDSTIAVGGGSKVYLLRSIDDWDTFAEQHVFDSGDIGTVKIGSELRQSWDGTVLVINVRQPYGCVVLRTEDDWVTISLQQTLFVAGNVSPVSAPSLGGSMVAMAGDEFFELHQYDPVANSYILLETVQPPTNSPDDFAKGLVWSGTSARLLVLTGGPDTHMYVYGRHGGSLEIIADYNAGEVQGAASPWPLFLEDSFTYGDAALDSGNGGMLILNIPEVP